jgi:hypothetical protein
MLALLFIVFALLGVSVGSPAFSLTPRQPGHLIVNPANPDITQDYPADTYAFVGNRNWTLMPRKGGNAWVHKSRWGLLKQVLEADAANLKAGALIAAYMEQINSCSFGRPDPEYLAIRRCRRYILVLCNGSRYLVNTIGRYSSSHQISTLFVPLQSNLRVHR